MLISYKRLRTVIGFCGMLLPFLLVIPLYLSNGKVLFSISDYYNTQYANILTSILCVTGTFLVCYNGYDKVDNLISKIAGVCALCVALFPTTYKPYSATLFCIPFRPSWFQEVHVITAIIFFLSLAYMSAFQFTKCDKDTPTERLRVSIYRICAIIMVIGLVFVGIATIYHIDYGKLIGESVALIAFGISWLIKGKEFFLKDETLNHEYYL